MCFHFFSYLPVFIWVLVHERILNGQTNRSPFLFNSINFNKKFDLHVELFYTG